MKFHLTFFSSLLIGLLLLSGQVFAGVTYYSRPGTGLWLATGTWSNVSCASAGTGGIPNATDTLIICNGSAVSVGAVSVGLNATVEVGGSLNLVTNVLTLTGALTNNGGTINGIGAQAFVAQSIIHNGGITNLMGVTTDSVHAITVNATGLTLPTGLILIDNLFTSNVDFTMPGSVATITGNIAVTGGTLTLTNTSPSITGTITTDGTGSISGSTGGTTITSGTLPTPPLTCASNQHLVADSAGVYTCVLDPDPTTVPAPPTCLSSEHLTGSAGAYLCVPNPVFPISAPIFSINQKIRVFTEDII